ncbi:MAG: hypothetical protein F6K54_35030 [Okeania sp. SIO3B5]|uniref:hypothetical protein n=1 Tax=Okeania sp. SIO3B5 TaxID=2607811 RepID=UPI001400650E|nr:hypothetical protein [Okeania sp. SIO3B5]NEO57815.1 hypothetical protein [Okeania sp. SIO3B5]
MNRDLVLSPIKARAIDGMNIIAKEWRERSPLSLLGNPKKCKLLGLSGSKI